jgi:hypothetical protein
METWEIIFICATIGSVVVIEIAKALYILWPSGANGHQPAHEGSRLKPHYGPTFQPNASGERSLAENKCPTTR